MNQTIENQLNHRSIRKFKDQSIPQDIVNALVDVARHTATSSFMQAYTIISITDKTIQQELSEIGKQPYIAQAGHLFVMCVDQHRNTLIAHEKGSDSLTMEYFDRFFTGATDAILAAQNIMVAAESLGLGGVFLGSILNNVAAVCALLKLPDGVAPVLGIALGYPDQSPQLKPRLPQQIMHFENTYPELSEISTSLKDYDSVVETYYDLRDSSKRIDTFTNQVSRNFKAIHPGRAQMLEFYRKQHLIEK